MPNRLSGKAALIAGGTTDLVLATAKLISRKVAR